MPFKVNPDLLNNNRCLLSAFHTYSKLVAAKHKFKIFVLKLTLILMKELIKIINIS